jgi:methionyl-tRNA formyltransferase
VPLRIVFCGTPSFALPALEHILAQPDFQVEGIVTQPDRPRGRGLGTSVSPVKKAALEAGIAVYQPEIIKSDQVVDYFARISPDVVVIIAYGQIIPAHLLVIPRLGWINLHASLLPKYRGAAPINWSIVEGQTRTGVTTMQVEAGLDTGPVLLQRELAMGPDETAPVLRARLAEAGAPLMVDTLRGIERGEIVATPQDNSQATFARQLKKEDGRIDWLLAAEDTYRRIRGFEPWPGAFTRFRGKHCRVWGRPRAQGQVSGPPGTLFFGGDELTVACGNGTMLRLEFLQLEGRKRVTALEFANGARLTHDERFGI